MRWYLSATIRAVVPVACALLAESPPSAAEPSPTVPTVYAETAELFGGIPADIFYAMALQESGRQTEQGFRPWPWTLNVEGKGFYYGSKAEAWDALSQFVEDGRTNIGIGALQVTWPYNQHVLVDVYGALDPHTNLQIAAQIFLARYSESGDWWTAVGRYHSPGPSDAQRARANAYRERVRKHWLRLQPPAADPQERP